MSDEQQEQQMFMPAPLPMGVNLDILKSVDGQSWVKLEVAYPAGIFVAFFPPEGAIQFGQDMQAIGEQASGSKIVVPDMNGASLKNIRSDKA